MFKAQCVTVRDPFHPMRGREIRTLDCAGPISALAPETKQPFIILRNGQAVLRADWNQPVADGDLMAVVLLPQGGDDGGSDVLRIVLMIVVLVVAWYYAPALAGAFGGTSAGAVGVAQAAIGIVGMALVNAILPPPSASGLGGGMADYKQASPTYNVSAQGNSARLGGAIPIQYGRLNVFPDFAASPYVEYEGNEQYLYELLCIGVGEYEIEQIRIEDSDISSFEEITYEVVGPNEVLDLFPAAVGTSIEVSGQEMAYNVELGPFVANNAGTLATRIAVDVVCPRGLYYAEDSGALSAKSITFTVQAREVDDDGVAVGSWVTVATETVSAATSTPQRYTFTYSMTNARYEVKVTRTSTKDDSSRSGHEMVWAGLRTHLVSDASFGNVTLLALKMRATNSLSAQASRKINVTCTRKLYQWTGAAWAGPVATRNPAWALADACHTVGLPDSRIDLDALVELAATWTARGDRFDGRFDSTSTFWDSVTKIAQAGRAKPYLQGGIMHFMRDQSASLPVALYSMRNIVRGSFSINFMTPTDDTADAVQVTYFDESTWKPRTLICKMPDSSALKPAKVELFGVVGREHAFREGVYMAAANRYRRTIIKFTTEMEGFIPSYGDLVAINHDLPQWGQHAEVVAWDAVTKTLALSEPMAWGSGTHYIGLRRRDGSVSGPYVATRGLGDNLLVNGDASAGNNAHFSGATYIASGGYGGGAHFTATGPAITLIGDDYIPAEVSDSYTVRAMLRSEAPSNLAYLGVVCYDANKREILPWEAWRAPAKNTVLYEAVAAGQTAVKIVPAGEAWFELSSPHSFLQMGIATDFSDLPQAASRQITAIDVSNPNFWLLTLASPLAAAWPVGTPVGNSHSGGTFTYAYIGNINQSWAEYAGQVMPMQPPSAIPGASLRAGTKYIRMLALLNYTVSDTAHIDLMSIQRSDATRLVVGSTPDFTPYTGQEEERTHITFGWGDTWRQLARVISVRPKDEYTVEMTCINEDASVHSADLGITAPAVNSSQLPATPSAPLIIGLDARSMPGAPTDMLITWQPSPGAEYYIVEQSADGRAWTRTAETRANNMTATALYGSQTIVRVSAVGSVRGSWATFNYALTADVMWNATDTTPMWTADSNLMWRY